MPRVRPLLRRAQLQLAEHGGVVLLLPWSCGRFHWLSRQLRRALLQLVREQPDLLQGPYVHLCQSTVDTAWRHITAAAVAVSTAAGAVELYLLFSLPKSLRGTGELGLVLLLDTELELVLLEANSR